MGERGGFVSTGGVRLRVRTASGVRPRRGSCIGRASRIRASYGQTGPELGWGSIQCPFSTFVETASGHAHTTRAHGSDFSPSSFHPAASYSLQVCFCRSVCLCLCFPPPDPAGPPARTYRLTAAPRRGLGGSEGAGSVLISYAAPSPPPGWHKRARAHVVVCVRLRPGRPGPGSSQSGDSESAGRDRNSSLLPPLTGVSQTVCWRDCSVICRQHADAPLQPKVRQRGAEISWADEPKKWESAAPASLRQRIGRRLSARLGYATGPTQDRSCLTARGWSPSRRKPGPRARIASESDSDGPSIRRKVLVSCQLEVQAAEAGTRTGFRWCRGVGPGDPLQSRSSRAQATGRAGHAALGARRAGGPTQLWRAAGW